ncbi:hypothetical protein E4N89_01405 [Treponema denticola]|uniref:hypothetical protein n=1 Tax=Treponema denticola TaxID=158 RepID=UPI003D8A1CAC
MLKRGNRKTYRLYKKTEKSFAKVPCEALDIRLPIEQNSQLHSFTASQLHSFTAEGYLCPNKFKYQLLKPCPKTSRQSKPGLLSLGFFHTPFKKPQGTQRTQRIIKECLTKPS